MILLNSWFWFGIFGCGYCGIIGTNGAGKTSTLKMLSGDILPSDGTATMNGFDLITNARDVRRQIGYCPQFNAQLQNITGKEHLYFFARIKGIAESKIEEFVNDLINEIGLTKYYNKPSGGYSGGNKRKLQLGIALVGNPKIIFLDEVCHVNFLSSLFVASLTIVTVKFCWFFVWLFFWVFGLAEYRC